MNSPRKTALRRSLARWTLAAFALAGTGPAWAAEAFPTKPIRIIVTSAAGGSLDVTTRHVARAMSEKLGQQIVVENVVGAGGLIAIRNVKAAPADGYTLLAAVNTVLIQQTVAADPGYEVAKDFVGVGPMTRAPFVMVTSATQGDKTFAEVIARAKADPGKITYASAGIGSTTHLAAAMFAQQAGVNLTHIPYKGNAAAWADLMAGRVDLLFEGAGGAANMIRDGRLRGLAITSTRRLDSLPDVPTIAERGVPSYSFYFWVGLLAPAATPKEVLQTLSGAMRSALSNAELKTRFQAEGAEVMSMSPDEFTQFLKNESSVVAKAVADAGVPKQ